MRNFCCTRSTRFRCVAAAPFQTTLAYSSIERGVEEERKRMFVYAVAYFIVFVCFLLVNVVCVILLDDFICKWVILAR